MIFRKISEHHPLGLTEEEYLHLVVCIECFRRSANILRDLLTCELNKTLADAAYKSAIVEYVKPYSVSNGDAKFKYKLSMFELAPSDVQMHETLVVLRDKVIAHSDLTPMQGKVFPNSASEQTAAIVSLNSDPQFPAVSDVLDFVERVIVLANDRRLQMSTALFLK